MPSYPCGRTTAWPTSHCPRHGRSYLATPTQISPTTAWPRSLAPESHRVSATNRVALLMTFYVSTARRARSFRSSCKVSVFRTVTLAYDDDWCSSGNIMVHASLGEDQSIARTTWRDLIDGRAFGPSTTVRGIHDPNLPEGRHTTEVTAFVPGVTPRSDSASYAPSRGVLLAASRDSSYDNGPGFTFVRSWWPTGHIDCWPLPTVRENQMLSTVHREGQYASHLRQLPNQRCRLILHAFHHFRNLCHQGPFVVDAYCRQLASQQVPSRYS